MTDLVQSGLDQKWKETDTDDRERDRARVHACITAFTQSPTPDIPPLSLVCVNTGVICELVSEL